MYFINIPFQTDGSGNFSTTLTKSNFGQNPDENLIYEVAVNGTNLTGGTLLLKQVNTPYGFDITVLSLAAANVTRTYLPRATECDTSGVDAAGKILLSLVGDLQLTLAGTGANKSGKITLMVL